MNTFGPGKPGGGNLGFAVNLRTEISVARADAWRIEFGPSADAEESGPRRALVFHAMEAWSYALDDPGKYQVVINQTVPCHIGLASSSALQTAIIQALNRLNGEPLSSDGMRRLLSGTYREADSAGLRPGFTTGLSAYLGLFGGFALMDTSLEPLAHFQVPAWQVAVCVVPGASALSSGESEVRTLMGAGRSLDAQDSPRKMALIRETLLPALEASDLGSLGKSISALQRLGSKRAEIALHGERIVEALQRLLDARIECAFLSAVGPGIILLSEMGIDRLDAIIGNCGLQTIALSEVDNLGAIIVPH